MALAHFFSIGITGTFSATVILERSPDNANWYPCSTDGTGTAAQWTTPMSVDVQSSIHPLLYRLRCSSYASGTVNWFITQ